MRTLPPFCVLTNRVLTNLAQEGEKSISEREF